MASSFLKRLAEEGAKKIDKSYGASAYGGSSTLRPSTQTNPNGGGNGAPVTRASDFLTRLARERSSDIDREYGANAYGGSQWTALDKESGFDAWVNELNSFSERMSSDYASRERASREGVYQSLTERGKYRDDAFANISAMQGRADIYRSYFENNRKLYGDETVDGILSTLDKAGSYFEDVRSGLDSEYEYWKQWAKESAAVQPAGLPSGSDMLALARQWDNDNLESLRQRAEELEEQYGQLGASAGQEQLESLYGEKRRTEEWLRQPEDEAERRQLESRLASINEQIAAYEAATGVKDGAERAEAGELWRAARDEYERAAAEMGLEKPGFGERVLKMFSGAGKQYLGSTWDTVGVMVSGGTAEAEIYQEQLESLYGEKQRTEEWLKQPEDEQERRQLETRLASINEQISVYEALARESAGLSEGVRDAAAGITQSGAADLERAKYGAGKAGQLLVDAGAAAAQMAADAALGTVTGFGSMAPMMVRSFGGGAQQAREKGYSQKQQIALGLSSAATEYFSEKLFGGNPVYDSDAGLVSKLVGKITSNETVLEYLASKPAEMLYEGLEEITADLLEPLAEQIIAGQHDELTLEQIIDDGIVGVMTAGMAQGGVKLADTATQGINTWQTGKRFSDMGEEAVRAIVQEGLDSGSDTQSYKLAQELQHKLDRGESISNAELGRLYQNNVQAIDAEEGGGLLDRAAEELTNDGRVTNSTARDILENPTARAMLETEVGLSITEDMTKSQQRAAVKSAVEDLASRANGADTAAATNNIAGQATEQTAAQARPVAQQAYDTARIRRAASALGENGAKALAAAYDGSMNADGYYVGFSAYYEAGLSGRDMDMVKGLYAGQLNEAQRYAAYAAGKNDAAASLAAERKGVKSATVYGDEAGFIQTEESANLPRSTVQYYDNMAKAVGVKIQIAPSTGEGGANGWYANGILNIAKDAEKPGMVVAKHEITHRMQELAPKEYRKYRDYAVNARTEQYGSSAPLVAEYKARYAESGINLTTEQAMDEIAADFTEALVTEPQRFEQLAKQNRSVAQKLLDAVRDFIDKVKGLFKGNKTEQNQAAAEAFGTNIESLEKAARLWNKALKATARQAGAMKASKNAALDGAARLSIKYDQTNNPYVVIDSDILAGVAKSQWVKTVKDNLRQKFPNGVTVGNNVVSINQQSRKEMTFSKYMQRLFSLEPQMYADKLRATNNAGEILRAARKWVNEALLHPRADAIIDFARGEVLLRVGKNDYTAQVIVGNRGKDGLLLYDIINLAETTIQERAKKAGAEYTANAQNEPRSRGPAPADDSIPQSGGDVKGRFSLKADSTGRALTKEQQEYFKDSKATDSDGRLMVLYHQTENEFTVFDPRRQGAGARDDGTPFGIFLKSSDRDIGLKGKKQMALYANITNPLAVSNRDDLVRKLRQLSPEYDRAVQQHEALDQEYHEKFEAAKTAWRDYVTKWREENPGGKRSELYDVPEFNRLFDAEDAVVDEWTEKADALSQQAKETLTRALRDAGYDGVFLLNDTGSWGRSTDAYIALDPEQVKNIDNKAPTTNPDIRYSLKGYSQKQLDNWAGSKSIEVYENQSQLQKFVQDALGGKNLGKKLYFGAIPEDLAARIKADTGLNVEGYNCSIAAQEIRKIFKSHGNESKEALRGQRAITAEDFLAIPEVIQSPDQISLSNKLYEGRPVILFAKELNGRTTVVSYVSGKHMDLTVQTMYAGIKKGNLATPTDATAPAITPEAGRGTVSFMDSISQGGRDVKEQYSLKGSSNIQREMAALQRENEALRERVDYWKGQTKRTERVTTDKKAVAKAARELVRSFGADVDAESIQGDLQALYDYIASGSDGKDELTYTEARRRAEAIAQNLVESATAVDDDGYRQYSDLRDYLRTTNIVYGKESHGDIADFGAFRRGLFGRLNLKTKGNTNIDQVYQELSSLWPEFFDEQRESTPTDQLLRIAEVLDGIYNVTEYNPFSNNMEEAVTYAANEIMESFFDLPQTRATFADRQAAKLDEARAKGKQQVQQLREQDNARMDKLREQNKQRIQRVIERERAVRERQLQRLRDHYAREQQNQLKRRADSQARDRLLKIAKRLQNKKLPAVNRALLDQYIGDLDTTAKSITGESLKRLTDLREWYDDRKRNDPDFISDPAIEADLARLSKRQIKDLSALEVADLTRALLHIENELRTERQLIDSEDRRDVYLQGVQAINDVENSGGSREGVRGAFDNYIVTETLSPVRQIKRMAGYVKSDPLIKLVNALADGQRESLAYQMEAEKPFQKWAENKRFRKSFSGAEAKAISIPGLSSGKGIVTVEITPAMRAALYLHSLNDQNLRHIRDGGITVPDMKLYRKGKLAEAYARGTTVKLTPSQVRSITAGMTAEERAFAKAAHDYFNGQSRERINAVSEKLKGYSIAQVENYFPINTDSSFTRSDSESLKYDGTLEGMGFLKERQTRAANPILLRDVNTVLEQSITQHAKYVGLAIPVRNFNKVWGITKSSFVLNEDGSYARDEGGNYVRNSYESSVQKAVKNAWGESGYKYVEKLRTDLQNGKSEKNIWTRKLNKIRSNYAGAVLTLNLSVAMKQAASYPTAAAVLGWGPLARAMTDVGKVDLDLIAKYTPLQWYRSKGFSTKELGDLRQTDGPIAKVMNNLPAALNWVQGADLITTRKLWKASEYYVRANNKSLNVGTDAYYKVVAEIYNRVIEETQPNYTTMQRPQLLRSDDSLLGNLAMFKTQPFQNFNILYDAIGEYKAARKNGADIKEAKTNLSRAVTSQLAQLATFAGMTMAYAMFRGKPDKYEDEDGEMTILSVLKALGKDMAGGALSGVPFGSDAWELLSSKLFGDKYYGMDAVTVTAIKDTLESLNGMGELLGGILRGTTKGEDDEKEEETDWNSVRIKMDGYLDDISKAAGVPYENVANLFNAIYRHGCIATMGKYRGEYAALKLTAEPEKKSGSYYDLLYQAMEKSPEEYKAIYQAMVESGSFEEEKIKNAMESRMKKAQGVESASELARRFLSPAQEQAYSGLQQQVSGTTVWSAASAEQRKAAEEAIYDLTVGNSSGEKLQEKIDAGAAYGIDEADYVLYKLALSICDQPSESGKLGSYTNDEVEAAIDMLPGLSDAARSYLWEAQGKSEKSNPWR